MKKALLEMLICPLCLPEENRFNATILEVSIDDIVEGVLRCEKCGKGYPIHRGTAFLDPNRTTPVKSENRYETLPILSSYLWSHFGDLLKDEFFSDAYNEWAGLMKGGSGVCLDIGSAVGRFSFEMAKKCDFVVGIDSSVSFIQASRDLMTHRMTRVELLQEGVLTEEQILYIPKDWSTENMEFIVGDALALPFRSDLFPSVASLNVIDKISKPLTHLTEINRVAKKTNAQFLFSDPFSWSKEVAGEEDWLGGKNNGHFSGRGKDNIKALLQGKTGAVLPEWKIESNGDIWWKIRTHSNHFELIRSCFLKATR